MNFIFEDTSKAQLSGVVSVFPRLKNLNLKIFSAGNCILPKLSCLWKRNTVCGIETLWFANYAWIWLLSFDFRLSNENPGALLFAWKLYHWSMGRSDESTVSTQRLCFYAIFFSFMQIFAYNVEKFLRLYKFYFFLCWKFPKNLS